ncbi:hypothetical protein [Pseudomonas sp. HLT2-19-2]
MIETFEGNDIERLKVVLDLRRVAFAGSRRDQKSADAWHTDTYDSQCRHVLVRDSEGEPIASLRMALDGHWPLEDRYRGALDKERGVEFGRLGVARFHKDGKRILHELVVSASQICIELERPFIYGMTIAPFWTTLKKAGVPLTVLSDTIHAYGEEQNVILFDARKLIAFYEAIQARRSGVSNGEYRKQLV